MDSLTQPLPPSSPRLLEARGREIAEDFLNTPDADARDFAEQQIGAIRAHLDSSLFDFARVIFHYRDLTPGFHGPICDFIGRWGQPGFRRLGIAVQRESFKTSVVTRANALWQAGRSEGGNATIAIFTAKEGNARRWLKAIREVIMTSKIYQRLYTDLLPPGVAYWDTRSMPRYWKWSDSELDLARTQPGIPEATITALGIGGAATGGHWTHIIKDDIIGLEESRSELLMQGARDWVDTARFLERPAEGGCDLFVYTRWHYNDVYRYFREKWPDEYKVYHRPALEVGPDGEERSSFPEKFTTAKLQRIRDRDPYVFASQFQSQPKAGREQSFDPDWLRYGQVSMPVGDQWEFLIDRPHYSPTISQIPLESGESASINTPLPWMETILLWDPAPSEAGDRNRERHARNGLVVAGMDHWGRIYVLSARGYREDPEQMMRIAIHTCIRWGCPRAAVEEVNFSRVYRHFANYLMRQEFRDTHISFIPMKQERQNKDARILSLIPDFRSGFIYLNEPECRQLVTEYKEYPYGQTRDLLDALAMYKYCLFRPLTIEERKGMALHSTSSPTTRRPGQLDAVNWPA